MRDEISKGGSIPSSTIAGCVHCLRRPKRRHKYMSEPAPKHAYFENEGTPRYHRRSKGDWQ